MNRLQRFFTAILPKSWAAEMQKQSREWMMQCPCGHEISVWDAGGIRYKAAGNPRRLYRCPKCGVTWHRVYRRKAEAPAAAASDRQNV